MNMILVGINMILVGTNIISSTNILAEKKDGGVAKLCDLIIPNSSNSDS